MSSTGQGRYNVTVRRAISIPAAGTLMNLHTQRSAPVLLARTAARVPAQCATFDIETPQHR